MFDDYWINYMTLEMGAKRETETPPYSNLKDYLKYRNIKIFSYDERKTTAIAIIQ